MPPPLAFLLHRPDSHSPVASEKSKSRKCREKLQKGHEEGAAPSPCPSLGAESTGPLSARVPPPVGPAPFPVSTQATAYKLQTVTLNSDNSKISLLVLPNKTKKTQRTEAFSASEWQD